MLNKYLLISFLLLSACAKEQRNDCFTGAGEETSITRQLSNFNKIDITDNIHLVLIQDSARQGELEITGPENLLEGISTEIDDKTLIINDNNLCYFVKGFDHEITVKLYIDKINRLDLSSVATVTTDGPLSLDSLEIFHYALSDCSMQLNIPSHFVYVQCLNSSHLTLTGNVHTLKGSVEQASDLNARFLSAKNVLIDNHSPRDIWVDGTEILFVKIYNSGNVFYITEPSNFKELNVREGTGDLIKK